MDTQDEIKKLLEEIRDNQREALAKQEEQIDLTRQRLEIANNQIEKSIQLQNVAVKRQKNMMVIGLPLIALCIGLIAYLIVKYF